MAEEDAAQVAEFETELEETHDELLNEPEPEPTAQGPDEPAEDAQAKPKEPEAEATEVTADQPEAAAKAAETQPKRYKGPDGTQYTWTELEEKGLSEWFVTNALQNSHTQELYRDLKETQAKPPESTKTPAEAPTVEQRQALATEIETRLRPLVDDFVKSGEVEEELVDFAPKFATRYAYERVVMKAAADNFNERLTALEGDYIQRHSATQDEELAGQVLTSMEKAEIPEDRQGDFLAWTMKPEAEGGPGIPNEATVAGFTPTFAKILYQTFMEANGLKPSVTKPRPEAGGGLPAGGRTGGTPARDEFEEFQNELEEAGLA